MKTKNTLLALTIFIMGTISIQQGCKKDKETATDSDTQAAKDNALADKTFEDVQTMADQAHSAGNGGSLSSYRLLENNSILSGSCATITVTPGVSDTTITIDFGSAFCLCADNRYRKGQVLINFTGRYRDSSTVITHSFNNYYVGSDTTSHYYKVTGTKTVTNMGHNSAGHLYYSIHVTGNLLNTSGQTLTWNSQRTREWIAGESTLIWLDDEYLITGSASGSSFTGVPYTLTITQALHVALNCWWIKDGKFDFTPGTAATRHVDYGGGTCDALATVTINGITYTISLL